jgi:hypothetical protein
VGEQRRLGRAPARTTASLSTRGLRDFAAEQIGEMDLREHRHELDWAQRSIPTPGTPSHAGYGDPDDLIRGRDGRWPLLLVSSIGQRGWGGWAVSACAGAFSSRALAQEARRMFGAEEAKRASAAMGDAARQSLLETLCRRVGERMSESAGQNAPRSWHPSVPHGRKAEGWPLGCVWMPIEGLHFDGTEADAKRRERATLAACRELLGEPISWAEGLDISSVPLHGSDVAMVSLFAEKAWAEPRRRERERRALARAAREGSCAGAGIVPIPAGGAGQNKSQGLDERSAKSASAAAHAAARGRRL